MSRDNGSESDRFELIERTTRFTERQRRRLSHQYGYGHRPLCDWGSGDLPAPYAEGDLLYLPEGSVNAKSRLYGMGCGYFVVSNVFSIDEGDAWYCRVTNDRSTGSDRLHIAWSERSSWPCDVNWMADFELVETADKDGLEQRQAILDRGWTFTPQPGGDAALRQQRDRLAELLLQVPGAVTSEMAYEDWWADVVAELEAQGIARPTHNSQAGAQ